MESPAIARYVELSRAILAPGAATDENYAAISDELDALWNGMSDEEQAETERQLGPLLVRSAAYDALQCHTCSMTLYWRRRGSALPWRVADPDTRALHCKANGAGPRFILCQECATKALEACDHSSYEQMLEDHARRMAAMTSAEIRDEAEIAERKATEGTEELLISQRQMIDNFKKREAVQDRIASVLQEQVTALKEQVAELRQLDGSAGAALDAAAQLHASDDKVIANQKGLIDAQQDLIANQREIIDSLHRLVRSLGGAVPEQAKA